MVRRNATGLQANDMPESYDQFNVVSAIRRHSTANNRENKRGPLELVRLFASLDEE